MFSPIKKKKNEKEGDLKEKEKNHRNLSKNYSKVDKKARKTKRPQ